MADRITIPRATANKCMTLEPRLGDRVTGMMMSGGGVVYFRADQETADLLTSRFLLSALTTQQGIRVANAVAAAGLSRR